MKWFSIDNSCHVTRVIGCKLSWHLVTCQGIWQYMVMSVLWYRGQGNISVISTVCQHSTWLPHAWCSTLSKWLGKMGACHSPRVSEKRLLWWVFFIKARALPSSFRFVLNINNVVVSGQQRFPSWALHGSRLDSESSALLFLSFFVSFFTLLTIWVSYITLCSSHRNYFTVLTAGGMNFTQRPVICACTQTTSGESVEKWEEAILIKTS